MKTSKLFYQLAFLIILFHSSFVSSDENQALKPYQLPKGVTAKDYLANTLIIKYKNVPLQGVKTFGNDSKNSSNSIKITYQKPILVFGDLAVKTLADQQKINDNGLNRIFEVGFESDISIEQVINEVLKDPGIEYAEPRFIYQTSTTPNDVDYVAGFQNYLDQVKAPQAWDIQPNANGVIIAIVDSGSDLQHVDLATNIYQNTADPANGIDDDNDGYIDNFRGWDFVGTSAANVVEDNNPDVPADSLDHGIHVSGLASAVTNNSIGISSIAQTAKLMILKVGADDNARAIYRGYDGIIYAANHGAKIINCSWGGPGGGAFGQDVINYAVSKGCLVVAAAGNDGDRELIYPAAYKGAFTVANVRADDVKSSSSSYGYHVSISSPGASIYSTVNRDRYGYKSGTSMATPIVSSAAALVLAKNPGLTGVQVGELLRLNTDDISSISGNSNFQDQLGNGRLNVFKALNAMNMPSLRNQKTTISDKSLGAYAIGDTLSYYFDLKNVLQASSDINVTLSSTNASVQVLNATLTTGAFAASETKKIGPFKVVVKQGTLDNTSVLFKLSYSSISSSYQDKEFFNTTVNLDYQNITVNKVYTTITSNGRVGFSGDNASNGLGFVYKDFSLLYEAALMIGNAADKVSNNARGINGVVDNHFNKVVRVGKINNSVAAYEGVATSSDLLSPSPLNIEVKNRQIAYKDSPDDKYVVVEYEIFNKSTATINNIYVALFTDWDVDDGTKNLVKYDAGLKMGYTYASTPLSPYAGVKLLSAEANPLFYPLSYQVASDLLQDGSFTIAEKYQTLSSGVGATSLGSGNGLDVMFVIGNGTYSIPVNGSVKVAFAFIAGDNITDISNSAIVAQAKYTQLLTAVEPVFTAKGFDVAQNFPNPVKQETQISIYLPGNGKTTIEIYDLTGKKIFTLLNAELKKGTHSFNLDASNLNSGIYFYKTSFEGLEKVMKMVVIK
ncbi:S8/S53 family peptidase [Pedobacter cryophilus]|uniref:T9SS type A sorting domain-containing protein n=1 Tax=Pedobacter cryophilus TaxID=2571271 RepID=A0A4U1C3N3_9SPHI|nr:S8/S53 family peptidase [Pedobacter cryophilus]TKB98719.1 T9SS type A sorting domain-containing protein [Pedobacter cryophilus]